MFSNIQFATVKMLCPTHTQYVDVPIQFVTKGKELYLVDSCGCDFGFNDSVECQKCRSAAVKKFKASYSET